jgi:CheY-like chemotaxis protein
MAYLHDGRVNQCMAHHGELMITLDKNMDTSADGFEICDRYRKDFVKETKKTIIIMATNK